MKQIKKIGLQAAGMLFLMTILCGVLYTAFVTGIGQLLFPHQANGSILKSDGVSYGSEFLAQDFTENGHMWGRIINANTSTFTNEQGEGLFYAGPSNLTPKGAELKTIVDDRVSVIREANPTMQGVKIPVDLVTCSGSGLDPEISIKAAEFQIDRLAKENKMREEEIREIIQKCTNSKIAGIFGEETVNVLKVNLMLEGLMQ